MTRSIERRSSPRSNVSGIVQVLPPESRIVPASGICSLGNASLNSVYLFMERYIVRERMQVVLPMSHALEQVMRAGEFDPSVISPEFMVEVVRQDTFPDSNGLCGIAAKLLNNIQLRLIDGLLVPQSRLWNRWTVSGPALINVYA